VFLRTVRMALTCGFGITFCMTLRLKETIVKLAHRSDRREIARAQARMSTIKKRKKENYPLAFMK